MKGAVWEHSCEGPQASSETGGVFVEGLAILVEPVRQGEGERNSLCCDSDPSFPLRLMWPRKHIPCK